jgi:hypothetical protein
MVGIRPSLPDLLENHKASLGEAGGYRPDQSARVPSPAGRPVSGGRNRPLVVAEQDASHDGTLRRTVLPVVRDARLLNY